jgi:hypothetical protein
VVGGWVLKPILVFSLDQTEQLFNRDLVIIIIYSLNISLRTFVIDYLSYR